LKIKLAALLALCIFVSGIAGIQGASATNSTTFTNVDLKNGETLTTPTYGALDVKGLQLSDGVALRVGWNDYVYPSQNYTVKVSVDYEDFFGEPSIQDYYFHVTDGSGPLVDYWFIPFMGIDKDNSITIQILPDEGA